MLMEFMAVIGALLIAMSRGVIHAHSDDDIEYVERQQPAGIGGRRLKQ
jgi:hypothetical protein